MNKLLRFAYSFMVMAFAAGSLHAADLAVGDQITYGSAKYSVVGTNLFTNGSFDDGVNGWCATNYTTAADAANFTVTATGGYDDGAYITTNGAGVSSAATIRQSIAITSGKTYYFAVYTSGTAPSSNNFQYNALFKMTDASTENGVIKAFEWPQGAGNSTTDWSKTEYVFTAESDYVGVRMGWNASSSFDGFQLYEIEEAGVDLTALNSEIATAEAQLATYEEGTEWYTSLAAAIATAKAATPADADEAAAAVTALQNAEEAAAKAYALSTAPIADGDYLIQNVETGYYMGGGNDWGTHASLLGKPQWFTLTLQSDGTYTLDSHQHNNSATAHFLGTNMYVDGGAVNWTIAANGEAFTIMNGGNYVAGNGIQNTLTTVTDGTAAAAQWVFVTKDEIIAAQASASATNPVDVTSFILNPELKRNYNTTWYPTWTVTAADGTSAVGNFKMGADSNVGNCAESYHSGNGFHFTQTIDGLKAGLYRMDAQAFYRQDGSDTENLPYMFMNDQQSTFPERTGSENSMATAYASFLNKAYSIDPLFVTVEEGGNLTVGGHNANATMWNIFGELTLTYYGDATVNEVLLADYINAYNDALAAAQAYVDVDMAEADKTALNTAITDNTIDVNAATQEEMVTATTNLKAAADAAAIAAKKYANTVTAQAIIDAGQTDLTSLIVNPSFETGNLTGWTSVDGGGTATNKNFTLLTGDIFVERWTWSASASNVLSDGSLTQVIQGLPAGTYTITAELQNLQQGDASVTTGGYFLAANDARAEVSAAGTYSVTFELDGTEDLTIGAILEGCTGNWVCVDNFTLSYEPTYVVAGSFNEWNGTDETTKMTKTEEGTYTYTQAMTAGSYEYKVVADGSRWIGPEGVNNGGNYTLVVASDCDVTFTYNPADGTVTATGDGVTDGVEITSVSVMGTLPGLDWETFTNVMTADEEGVYTYKAEAVPAGSYEFKFAANSTWDINFGTSETVAEGTEYTVSYNADNIKVTLAEESDLTLTLKAISSDAKTATFSYAVKATNDYTDYIVNADLSTTDAWATEGTKGIADGMVKCGSGSTFDFSQTIKDLPAGKYLLTAKAAYRFGANEQAEYDAIQAGTETHLATLYAKYGEKEYTAPVMNRYEGASETDYAAGSGSVTVNSLYVPNSSAAVKAWFDADQYINEVTFNLAETADVTIGIVKTTSADAGDYANIGEWTLTRLGDAEEEIEERTVAEFLAEANTEKAYQITGVVGSIKNTTYGNFNLTDIDNPETYVYVYGVVDAEGTQKIWEGLGINEKDTITIIGTYMLYKDSPQIKNAVYVSHKAYSGEVVDITNTPETAYTVSEAIALIEAGEGLSTKVYVKGTVKAEDIAISTEHGNATYYITDGTNDLYVYRGYYLDNAKFTSEDQLVGGEEVVIYGQISEYGGTKEINSGNYIYSLTAADGINGINAESANKVIYDLSGRRLKKAVKGVNIINGTKVLVK